MPNKIVIFSLLVCLAGVNMMQAQNKPITNFDKNGQQITKFSTLGDAIDAHDGEIAFFDGVYYLYGTSYGCGFEWGRKDAPFCGFKTYSSRDLINWTDRGQLFDASKAIWQTRCNGNTYGCFRPHVVYNRKTGLYVLWINVYDNKVGYRVFASSSPVGPFIEQAEPTLAINNDAPAAGLNNGDHDTFVDDDGEAYLAYTDWRLGGAIAIEQLSADYFTGTGKVIKFITKTKTEAPSLFKRNGIYYLLYSDPNCGYCSGTGAAYRTSTSLFGPWSEATRISDNSCGGQPSFVSTIKLPSGEVFLFGSDLWNNGAKNEALANYYWAPLTFAADGSINHVVCQNTSSLATPAAVATELPAGETLMAIDDLTPGDSRSQIMPAKTTGLLSDLLISCFKSEYPDGGLSIDVSSFPDARLLSSIKVPADSISWSPKNCIVHPRILVKGGKSYRIKITHTGRGGRFGFEYYSIVKGSAKRKLLIQWTIQ